MASKTYSDSYLRPYVRPGKPTLYGAAAREKRVKEALGIDNMLGATAEWAVQAATAVNFNAPATARARPAAPTARRQFVDTETRQRAR